MKPTEIFTCTKCGDCCRGYGGTYLTAADIEAIADYVRTDPDPFIEKYCTPSGHRQVLRQDPEGHCVFWDQVCTIHPVKPRMCKAWPYIDSILTDVSNWRIMAGMCPGMRQDVSDDIIRRKVRDELDPDG